MQPARPIERRSGIRARVDFQVVIVVAGFGHECWAVELGPTGMVVQLTRALAGREPPLVAAYELLLDGVHLLRLLARPVWRRDKEQAVRFISVSPEARRLLDRTILLADGTRRTDVDRLELAEAFDRAGTEARVA